jgi:hypothetical protein
MHFSFKWAIMAGSVSFWMAGPVFGEDSLLFPQGLTPLFEKPISNGFPIAYLESSDTCIADSSFSDGAGNAWQRIRSGEKYGWVRASSMLANGTSGASAPKKQGTYKKDDPDAKRRYRALEGHADWPRRIVKSIREGNICLDMNGEQVYAAWGEPFRKGKAFILGTGQQEMWYYKNEGGTIEVVFLNNGRVVGWSE